ncbi:MAG: HisA/HisF-related TIM barrel protein, partial [Oscillospiraceae bacterium]|nr:HisA/HisF-related TIM barrel protein [Oscillospiraceae bacterium]
AVEGWLDSSSVDYLSLAREMTSVGVKYIIYTDISRDGTLSGVNTEQLQQIHNAVGTNCHVIASGGVHTIADIQACKQMGLYGTICGKSLYQGTLQLEEAIACAGTQQ